MNAIIYSNRCIYRPADADLKAAMAFRTIVCNTFSLLLHLSPYIVMYFKIEFQSMN